MLINQLVIGILLVNVLGMIFLWKRNQNLLYSMFGFSLLSLLAITVAKDFTTEWRSYQKQFIRMQIEKTKDPELMAKIRKTPLRIKQIWNKELDIADRCTTCHLAIDNTLFKNGPEPFRYHEAAREHDFGKIGCTICHGGQGRATETHDAHGRNVVHWDFPMLELNMVELSCPRCHSEIYRPGYRLKGAKYLNMANNLSVNAPNGPRCVGCHPLLGGDRETVPSERWTGVIAPDLSIYGKSSDHEFEQAHDMTNVKGEYSKYGWTKAHFLNPEKIVPGDEKTGKLPTIMPNFKLRDEEAHALSLFVMTMKPSDMPAKYWYKEPKKKAENVPENNDLL
ncbi:MAG: hypothetical protein ACE5EN_01725 [Nitrospinota bacterium]